MVHSHIIIQNPQRTKIAAILYISLRCVQSELSGKAQSVFHIGSLLCMYCNGTDVHTNVDSSGVGLHDNAF